VENLLRENLTAIEEAEALDRVMKECNYSQNQMSEMIGKSLALKRPPVNKKRSVFPGKMKEGGHED